MHQHPSINHCQRNTDHGPEPFVTDIVCAAEQNQNFRTAIWTGHHLQVTLMCIPVGCDIGLERHEGTDQFIRIVQGCGMVRFGNTESAVQNVQKADGRCAVFVPCGIWHNIVNCGSVPLKLYSVYAPPHHPFGTVHKTKRDAENEHA